LACISIRVISVEGPPFSRDLFECVDRECATLIPCFRARPLQRFQYIYSLRFIHFASFKILIQQDQQHCVEVFLNSDRTNTLATPGVIKQTPSLNLQLPRRSLGAFQSIEPGLPRRR
jgi:hypothetical protein